MPKSNFTWEFYFEKIKKSQLSKPEIVQALKGLETLRTLLGKQFIEKYYRRHPLAKEIVTSALQSLLGIGSLGNNLNSIRKIPGFNRVKRELIHPEMFNGAEAEITLMGRLMQNGKEVEILDKGQKGCGISMPDFMAKFLKRWIIFEVSILQELKESKRSREINIKLGTIRPINSKGEKFLIRIDVSKLFPGEVEKLFDYIKSKIRKIIENSENFKGYIADNVYVEISKSNFALVHPSGPRVIKDNIGRIFLKISNKFKKFSGSNLGVLWISIKNDNFDNESQIERTSYKHLNDIKQFRTISALCIATIIRGPQRELSFNETKNVFFRQKKFYDNTLTESILFIKNPEARSLLDNSEVNEILSSYLNSFSLI